MQDSARANEADSGDDLGGDSRAVGDIGTCQPIGQNREQGRPEADEQVVRNPAGRCFSSRSSPTAAPRIAAINRRSKLCAEWALKGSQAGIHTTSYKFKCLLPAPGPRQQFRQKSSLAFDVLSASGLRRRLPLALTSSKRLNLGIAACADCSKAGGERKLTLFGQYAT